MSAAVDTLSATLTELLSANTDQVVQSITTSTIQGSESWQAEWKVSSGKDLDEKAKAELAAAFREGSLIKTRHSKQSGTTTENGVKTSSSSPVIMTFMFKKTMKSVKLTATPGASPAGNAALP